MRKGDIICTIILLICISLLIITSTRNTIAHYTITSPYIAGFIKFAILATMGEMIGHRIVVGKYSILPYFLGRILVWGVIGSIVVLIFQIFMGGTAIAQAHGFLPFAGIAIWHAFFGSTIMNLTFPPVLNTFHRMFDVLFKLLEQRKTTEDKSPITFSAVVNDIDWVSFIMFNWIKVSIFFWIPVHTVIFLLPETLRVISAAFASIALGVILAYAAKIQQKNS